MSRYKIGQELEIHSLKGFGNAQENGRRVRVVKLPGFHPTYQSNYLVRYVDNSRELVAHPDYLRPPPPPSNRGDMDKVTSWEEFESVTRIPADVVRGTDSEH
jgi:hypothetical protein